MWIAQAIAFLTVSRDILLHLKEQIFLLSNLKLSTPLEYGLR